METETNSRIFDISMITISALGIIFDILLLIIYIKNGSKGHLTVYKIILLVICLMDSICNLVIDPNLYSELTLLCKITGTLKIPLHLGLLSTQLILIFITYFSFKHSLFIDKHSLVFKIVIFLIWFLPFTITLVIELTDLFSSNEKQREMFCLITDDSNLYVTIEMNIYYIICLVFLIKLYRDLKEFSNNTLYQTKTIQKYKKYLKNYIYGYVFNSPDFIMFLYLLIFLIIQKIDKDFIEKLENNWIYSLIDTIIMYIYYFDLALFPIIIVIIYCFTKEHIKYLQETFCCKKEESINITKATAFLFDTSVVTINNDTSIAMNGFV